MKWVPLDNSSVLKQLHAGESCFFTTRRMCNCGTEIGRDQQLLSSLPPREPDLTRDLKKLRKRGWTESKCQRWAEQARHETRRKHDEALSRPHGPYPEVNRWISFVTEAVQQNHAAWVGILLHWYSGAVQTEAISLERRWLHVEQLSETTLLNAQPDVLYTVALHLPHFMAG